MESLSRIQSVDVGIPLVADEFVEFHAARLLLLIRFCGTAGRIDGLTKMAKLDFFVRYPSFFARASNSQRPAEQTPIVESSMVRFHYGPWDQRYYDVLAYLSARELINVTRSGETVVVTTTDNGARIAEELSTATEFEPLVNHMKEVKKAFGSKSGTALKDIVYRTFNAEVTQLRLGELISGE